MKTKSTFIISLLISGLLSFCFLAQAQNDAFYYYQGEKVYLEYNKQSIYLSFEGEIPTTELLEQALGNNLTVTSIQEDNSYKTINASDERARQLPHSNTQVILHQSLTNEEYLTYIQELESFSFVNAAAPSFQNGNGKKIGMSNYFLVKLKQAEDIDILQELATEHNISIVGNNQFMPLWYTLACNKTTNKNALEAANLFYETDLFAYAEPDLISDFAANCVEEPLYSSQWGLENTSQGNGWTAGIDIKACEAWETTKGNANIVVALMDYGVEMNHPDLAESMFNLSYDTYTGGTSVIRGSHATSCAGIISAQHNGEGIAGIAPDAQLMSISNYGSNNANGSQQRADGINWAWQNGASIISNSWSTYAQQQILIDAIDNALENGRDGLGTVVVFSSGNDGGGGVSYPAYSNPDILVVGSSEPCGYRVQYPGECVYVCWDSNFGPALDLVAPGVRVPTTDRSGSSGYGSGDYINNFEGTSIATPHVAGIAALVLSVNPCLTQQQVGNIIESTAQKIGGYSYLIYQDRPNGTWNNQMGHGFPNANAAVDLAQEFFFSDAECTENALCPKPEEVIATPISGNVASIEWQASEASEFFIIQYREQGTTNWISIITQNPIGYMNGLTPNTTYEFQIRAICNYGYQSDWTAIETVTTLDSVCDNPAFVNLNSIGFTSANIFWTVDQPALGYEFSHSDPTTGDWAYFTDLTEESIDLENLINNTPYFARVRVLCEGGWTSWTEPFLFTTLFQDTGCENILDYTVNVISGNIIRFNWEPLPDVYGYELRYREEGEIIWQSKTTTEYFIAMTNLTPNTTYEYQIRTICSENSFSEWSDIQSSTTTSEECDRPNPLSVYFIDDTEATIFWQSTSTTGKYKFSYAYAGSDDYTIIENIYATEFHLTGLIPSVSYDVRAKAQCTNGWTNWTEPITFTTLGESFNCVKPDVVDFNIISGNVIRTVWNPSVGGIGFNLRYREWGTSNWIEQGPLPVTYSSLNNLEISTEYEVQINSICFDGSLSDWSDSFRVTTTDEACDRPLDISIDEVGAYGAIVNFALEANASKYKVSYALAGTMDTDDYTTFNNVFTSPYTIQGLEPNTTYDIRVKSKCTLGWTNWSEPVTITTPPESCFFTEGFIMIVLSSDQVLINIVSPETTNFEINYKELDSSDWVSFPATGGENFLENLTATTTYQYRLRKICSELEISDWNNTAQFTTSDATCENPSDLTVSDITLTTAEVSWTLPLDMRWYQLSHSVSGTNDWIITQDITDPNYVIGNLDPNTNYDLRIRTRCETDFLNWSSPITFNTLPETCPFEATNVNSIVDGVNVQINWDDESNAQSYQVRYKEIGTNNWTTVNSANNNVIIYSLNNNREYIYKIRAFCAEDDHSLWSETYTFTVSTPCIIPQTIELFNLSENTANISWTHIPSSQAYDFSYKLEGANDWNIISNLISNNYTINDFEFYTNYEVRVRTVCLFGLTDWSETFTLSVNPECIFSNQNVSSMVDGNSVHINWDVHESNAYYQVRYRLTNTDWVVLQVDDNFAIIDNLDFNRFYHYEIKAICAENHTSEWSETYNFLTEIEEKTSTNSLPANSINVFPNPSSGLLYLEGLETTTVDIQIINTVGTTLLKFNNHPSKQAIHVEGLAKGTYLISIKQGEKTIVKRFIKTESK